MNCNPPKNLSKNYLTEKRFLPYSKASSYIQHMSKLHDSFMESPIPDQTFKVQPPTSFNFKVSLLPKSKFSEDLERKKTFSGKFCNFQVPKAVKENHLKRSATPIINKDRARADIYTMNEFRQMLNVIHAEKRGKCNDCRKNICECINKTQDEFLKEVLISRGYKNKSTSAEKIKEKPPLICIASAKNKETRFFASKKNIGAYPIFNDEGFTAIHTGKKNKFPIRLVKRCKTARKKIPRRKSFIRALSVTPVAITERPKNKENHAG
ncbi:hypothetical protein SteCoe_15410 [Stentor coeruleus]|uniref:Uncharacterized protein n=1 Tax=Stentor coeruleus TaxID=5963 RepID=A0A1R2C3M7_9CILI|nr:hypothetical protein SteCoe_15410 [Stentor coeruleus]